MPLIALSKVSKNKRQFGVYFLIAASTTFTLGILNNFLGNNIFFLSVLASVALSYYFIEHLKKSMVRGLSVYALADIVFFTACISAGVMAALFLIPSQYIADDGFLLTQYGLPLPHITDLFQYILVNNLTVLLVTFVLSIVSVGLFLLILIFNLSNIFLYIQDDVSLLKALSIIPHGALELAGYLFGALSAFYIATHIKKITRKDFFRIFLNLLILISTSIFLVYLGAALEVFVASKSIG